MLGFIVLFDLLVGSVSTKRVLWSFQHMHYGRLIPLVNPKLWSDVFVLHYCFVLRSPLPLWNAMKTALIPLALSLHPKASYLSLNVPLKILMSVLMSYYLLRTKSNHALLLRLRQTTKLSILFQSLFYYFANKIVQHSIFIAIVS